MQELTILQSVLWSAPCLPWPKAADAVALLQAVYKQPIYVLYNSHLSILGAKHQMLTYKRQMTKPQWTCQHQYCSKRALVNLTFRIPLCW